MERLYTKTVTIWNRLRGGAWDHEQWFPTVIENARLIVSKGNNVLKSGLETADTARLHISDEISKPDKPYVDPITWKNAPTRHYTLESEEGSFFTEGDTSSAEITETGFFEKMEQTYPACFRISKVDRFEVIPHFEVFGK